MLKTTGMSGRYWGSLLNGNQIMKAKHGKFSRVGDSFEIHSIVAGTVPAAIPAPRKLALKYSPLEPEVIHNHLQEQVPGMVTYNTQGKKSSTVKCCSLSLGQNWETKGAQSSKWFLSGHSPSPPTLSEASRELSNQITHSHAVSTSVYSCGSLPWVLKLLWFQWVNKYPKFGTSLIGSQGGL